MPRLHAYLSPLLPMPLKRLVLNACGHAIDRSARIGLSFIDAEKITMGPESRIGHFNIIKALEAIELDRGSRIGNFNWIGGLARNSAKHFTDELGRRPILALGEWAGLTSRHFVDCSNTVRVGKFSTVAGAGTQILTHGIDIRENRQRSAPTSIGDYCFVSTACVLVKGSALPNYSVLGANSTLHKPHAATHTLYSGVPATAVTELPSDAAYFHRTEGFVP